MRVNGVSNALPDSITSSREHYANAVKQVWERKWTDSRLWQDLPFPNMGYEQVCHFPGTAVTEVAIIHEILVIEHVAMVSVDEVHIRYPAECLFDLEEGPAFPVILFFRYRG